MLPPLYHHRMFITFALWMFSFYTVCTLQLVVLGSGTINFTINSVFLVDPAVWFLFDVLNVVCVHMLVLSTILTWKMYCAHILECVLSSKFFTCSSSHRSIKTPGLAGLQKFMFLESRNIIMFQSQFLNNVKFLLLCEYEFCWVVL